MRHPLLLSLLAAGLSGCGTPIRDRYVCFPPSTCRRAEAVWKFNGAMECYGEMLKSLDAREAK